MKLALVTTSPAIRSPIGAAVRELLPHLRELCELQLFVEPGGGTAELAGVPFAPITTLDPRAFDRLLFPVGNEPGQAFVPRVVRALGGTVMLYDWGLYDLACAAYPALARGGLKGLVLALREGGLEQVRIYARERRERGRASTSAELKLRLSFNRSIVRHADSFLVHDSSLGRRILTERNARTAIGVVPRGIAAPDDDSARRDEPELALRFDADEECHWSVVAQRTLEHLQDFPGPRVTRGARIAFGALWTSA